MAGMMFMPEPIPPSAMSHASIAQSVDDEPVPRRAYPHPYPSYADRTLSTQHVSSGESEERPSLLQSGHRSALGSTSGLSRQQSNRPSCNYGSSARISALLEQQHAIGCNVASDMGEASSSVLSRPALNSSVSRQQRAWDAAASARLSKRELEKRVKREIKRIETEGRDQVEQGQVDTLEASWVLEESQMKEGLGTEELFRGLVPLTQDVRQVFRAKVVKKQIDRKWKSSLALKPSMDLFADEVCGRQVANAQALEGDLVQAGESLMKEDVTGRVVKILPSLHFKECKQLLYSQRRSR